MSKNRNGRFFEDFALGETIQHPTPRTLTDGDGALYAALYGSRFAVQSSEPFARSIGYPRRPLDDWLVFHMIFGKTVPDISLNAVANLGYADGRFLKPVYPGATLTARSEVIGLKESSNGRTGIVYVRSLGFDETGDCVLAYCRFVLVAKGSPEAKVTREAVPDLPVCVPPEELGRACPEIDKAAYDCALSGSFACWQDYAVGERIDHRDGMTVEEAEHQLATRLYQNTARVHFDAHAARSGRFQRRLIYGGHAISLTRALSFNGLANAFHVAALNGGRHVAPLFAGDTVYAWSEILDKAEIPGRNDIGALRVRTVATKNRPCADFPEKEVENENSPVILDLDTWLLLPR